MSGRGVVRQPDLRLAGTAVGCWLAALTGLRTTALVCGVLVGAALLAGVIVIALTLGVAARAGRLFRMGQHNIVGAGGRSPWAGLAGQPGSMLESLGWIAAAALLGMVIGATATGFRVAQRDAQPLAGLARDRETVRVQLVVGDDPKRLATARTADTVLFPAHLVQIRQDRTGWVRTSARVVVIAVGDRWPRLVPGQRVQGQGRLAPSRSGDLTAAVLFVQGRVVTAQPPPWYQKVATGLRSGLRRACAPLPTEPGGLLPGLVVGDTSRLAPSLVADFGPPE